MTNKPIEKLIGFIAVLVLFQLFIYWKHVAEYSDRKGELDSEVYLLSTKKNGLLQTIKDLRREESRIKLRLNDFNNLRLGRRSKPSITKDLPIIFFVTPTGPRPSQKADLIRLSQTLFNVPNLYWVLIEDSEQPSPFINEIVGRSGIIHSVHLTALTPGNYKHNLTGPVWKFPKGVNQRNIAIDWIRNNFASLSKGVVYFGDDDNVYDWRVFDEIRSVKEIGVWPVGLVGGLLAETPLLDNKSIVSSFNALWKPGRPFPIDMAGFAINITVLLKNKEAKFIYDVPRGYQESRFLESLNVSISNFEPKADLCSKVYVWHTRTARTPLIKEQVNKFLHKQNLTPVEKDSIQ